jgi:hypothetical protein
MNKNQLQGPRYKEKMIDTLILLLYQIISKTPRLHSDELHPGRHVMIPR